MNNQPQYFHAPLVIDHVSDKSSLMEIANETVTPASCMATSTTVITPQSSCSCSSQQQTSASSSSSDSDIVTIVTPVVVVLGVIILILVVVIGILVWRNTKSGRGTLPYDKVVPTTSTVENDLYGLVLYISCSSVNIKFESFVKVNLLHKPSHYTVHMLLVLS